MYFNILIGPSFKLIELMSTPKSLEDEELQDDKVEGGVADTTLSGRGGGNATVGENLAPHSREWFSWNFPEMTYTQAQHWVLITKCMGVHGDSKQRILKTATLGELREAAELASQGGGVLRGLLPGPTIPHDYCVSDYESDIEEHYDYFWEGFTDRTT